MSDVLDPDDDDDPERHQLSPEARENIARILEQQASELRKMTAPLHETLTQYAAALRPTQAIIEHVMRTFEPFRQQALLTQKIAASMPTIDFDALAGLRESVARALAGVDFSAITKALQRGLPPNWRNLGPGWEFQRLFEITEAGYPTAWVPRAEVLQQLIDAPDNDWSTVFETHSSEVIADCIAVVDEIDSVELADLTVLLREAADIGREGKFAAAQALAAAVFDTVLRHTIVPEKINGYYKRVKTEILDRHENASIAELRWGLAHIPAVIALKMFDQSKGDAVPDYFNRHASAHAAGRVQYTSANAIVALALATSLLREAHQTIVDNAAAAA